MVFTPCLDGLRPVELLQNHDSRQVMGEGHGAHGELEVRSFLYSFRHAEGGADEKAGAAFSGELHFPKLFRKALAGKGLSLRGVV